MGAIAGNKRKLRKEYISGGYKAVYVKNEGDVYLYERTHVEMGGTPHYEVVLPYKHSGEYTKDEYTYPPDSFWGKKGWTLTSRERAEEKFNELIKKQ